MNLVILKNRFVGVVESVGYLGDDEGQAVQLVRLHDIGIFHIMFTAKVVGYQTEFAVGGENSVSSMTSTISMSVEAGNTPMPTSSFCF